MAGTAGGRARRIEAVKNVLIVAIDVRWPEARLVPTRWWLAR